MRRALAVTGLILLALLGWLLLPSRDAPSPTPSPTPARSGPTVQRVVPAARPPTPDDAPAPTPPAEQVFARLADAAGMGRIACPLPPGIDAGFQAPGLQRMRISGGTLHALVDTAHGQSVLRGRTADGVGPVGIADWDGAEPGQRGLCTVLQPGPPVEHRLVVTDGQLTYDAIDAHRLRVTGCESADPPDLDGAIAFVALAGTPCRLRVVDPATGDAGSVRVDARAPTTFTVTLDEVDDRLVGTSRAERRQLAFIRQHDAILGWIQVYEAALDGASPPVAAGLRAELARLQTAADELAPLTEPAD